LDISSLPKDTLVFKKVSLDLKSGTIEMNLTARNFGVVGDIGEVTVVNHEVVDVNIFFKKKA
jgi:hypothetical protein